jgi:hypothetical protein
MIILKIIWAVLKWIILFNESQKQKLELLKKLDEDINKAIEEMKRIKESK